MNRTFLDEVAADMLHKLGNDLSRTVVIFPNKRARLFFAESLYRSTRHALWSPSYLTISELFHSYTSLAVTDEIKLVTELHRSYRICTGSEETLDHFYGWGQVMLNDFDDIDKNMADAGKVLSNVADLHEMDDLSYLSKEQLSMLKQFFGTLVENKSTEMKRRFLQMWKQLHRIYTHYNQSLNQQGLAYEGALYRSVVCTPQLNFPFDKYVFVGFNMVHPVEKNMFQRIKDEGKAMFYWDFDHYYMQSTHEAGHYISKLIEDFPNELNNHSTSIYECFKSPKNIRLFGASTDNIQARYVSQWLLEDNRYIHDKRTAIILCDEKMLPAIVHCIPDKVSTLNITTGYPLHLSPIVSLVHLLLSLQLSGYDKQKKRFLKSFMQRVKKHPYAKYLGHLDAEVYKPVNDKELSGWLLHLIKKVAQQLSEQESPFTKEALFRTYTIVNRVNQLISNDEISIDGHTLTRLLTQLLRQASVPFHGEPATGVQVMGVLETRNLDFDHMLILSCNEGNIPRGLNDTSFIPYSVRKTHGLTTIDNKAAIYAYYFYRMIQRAKDITLVYNHATANGKRGEMSRFVLQMLIESGHHIEQGVLTGNKMALPYLPMPVNKSEHTIEVLRQHFTATDESTAKLTPTAINRYLKCGLQFYYRYVLNIKDQLPEEDELMDQRTFGNIFHEASQHIYEQMADKQHIVSKQSILAMLKNESSVQMAVEKAFIKEFSKGAQHGGYIYNGLELINRQVIVTYLKRLLRIDLQLAPFQIIGLECDVIKRYTIQMPQGELHTTIGGRIDRLDCITDKRGQKLIRVIDYKTGSYSKSPINSIEQLFDTNRPPAKGNYYIQALLYSILVQSDKKYNADACKVSPALLFIQHAVGEDYDPAIVIDKFPVHDVSPYQETFMTYLSNTLQEIFDTNKPFKPTNNSKTCDTCVYRQMCGMIFAESKEREIIK